LKQERKIDVHRKREAKRCPSGEELFTRKLPTAEKKRERKKTEERRKKRWTQLACHMSATAARTQPPTRTSELEEVQIQREYIKEGKKKKLNSRAEREEEGTFLTE